MKFYKITQSIVIYSYDEKEGNSIPLKVVSSVIVDNYIRNTMDSAHELVEELQEQLYDEQKLLKRNEFIITAHEVEVFNDELVITKYLDIYDTSHAYLNSEISNHVRDLIDLVY